jgi:hypothetical protein
MRGLDIAVAAWAFGTARQRERTSEVRLEPVVDNATGALSSRAALPQDDAALVASLWPRARLCVVPTRYETMAAPARLGLVHRIDWLSPDLVDARALRRRLDAAFASAPTAKNSAQS